MNFKNKLKMLTTVLFTALLLTVNAHPQSGTTGISGTVLDQNSSPVAGATVKLVNPATGFNRMVMTGNDGKFNFLTVPPATYRIEVEAGNFKKLVNSSVQALVDLPLTVDLSLQPGDVSAVVDITSNTIEGVVNTQDASIGNNFVPQQIIQLPTDLRRVNDLLTLQPGATREGYSFGAHSDQSNITLDGVDINDQQTGGRDSSFQTTQDSALRATTESVEEFRITTTNANANQGRSSGAQISLVTKSGTNQLHGSAFYFYRPTAFSANNFFNNLSVDPDTGKSISRPGLARSVYGGSIGGPIKKDKLFYFYSYEGQKQDLSVSVVRTVPLASLGQGLLKFNGTDPDGNSGVITINTATLNSIFPSVGINPAAVAVFADAARRYPANSANGDGDGLNTGNYRFNSKTKSKENTHTVKFDYTISGSQTAFLRANYQSDTGTGTSYFPDTKPTSSWSHPYGFVFGHSWTISNSKVNSFRYGLTRQSFSNFGDSTANDISFRFVYQPSFFARNLSRVTPVQNITDDFTIIKGGHTIQFGGNIRIIRNRRNDLSNAFDSATANPSFYASSGRVLDRPISDAGYTIGSGQESIVQNAVSALVGRFSQYTGQYNYDLQGKVVAAGTPTVRNFATEEYDVYGQDIWKPTRNLTLTLGLRYGLSTPVYEKNGFEVAPTVPLTEFFNQRIYGSQNGVPFNGLINFDFAGPKYKKQGFYKTDKNNFQPRLAVAWSPDFGDGFLKTIFGGQGKSTFRGGFAITNDHFGEQLAVSFDQLSTLGFTTQNTIAANTYNTSSSPAPRFTGFGQTIRTLPRVSTAPDRFTTDVTAACLNGTEDCPQRIESSLDSAIVTPTHYSWNVSYGRELPKGIYIEASYVGRRARHLLAARDVNALNNLVDTKSGVDWYTAARQLNDLRSNNTSLNAVGSIPYFQNLFPNLGNNLAAYLRDGNFAGLTPTQAAYYLVSRNGYDILDWTFIQSILDDQGTTPNLFFHPQYAAFSAFSSVAKSNYQGAAFSMRQRLGKTLTYDLNYTFSLSKDDSSGLQTGGSYGSQFILNPLRQSDSYANSDFDTRHVFNANFIFQAPIGKGRTYFNDMNKFADTLFGGWQLSGVFRANSGLPFSSPFDQAQWATNWNVQSNGTLVRKLKVGANRSTQNIFADPQEAFKSFRNALPGETGQRNNFRLPGYSNLDLGLSKTFKMPYGENHTLQFRWEVFNVLNRQALNNGGETRTTYGLPQDPQLGGAPDSFGKILTDIQGKPRSMQFGLRYSF